MSAQSYYETAAALMKRGNPPSPHDPAAIEFLQHRGIYVGSDLRWWFLWPGQRIALRNAQRWGKPAILAAAYFQTREASVDGWRGFDTIGEFGTNYDARAAVAKFGLGANIALDAIYRSATVFNFSGGDYVLTFSRALGTPPVDAFWSITVYDSDGYFVPNELNRFALGSESGLREAEDGSITIFLQHDPP